MFKTPLGGVWSCCFHQVFEATFESRLFAALLALARCRECFSKQHVSSEDFQWSGWFLRVS